MPGSLNLDSGGWIEAVMAADQYARVLSGSMGSRTLSRTDSRQEARSGGAAAAVRDAPAEYMLDSLRPFFDERLKGSVTDPARRAELVEKRFKPSAVSNWIYRWVCVDEEQGDDED